MAGRSFTRHTNGIGNRIRAEHINELQLALEDDDARIDLKTDDGQFTAHVDDTDNPHDVTKAQVGLGNVDNTSDADKPVSTAQQAALDGKADVEDAVPAGGVYGQVLTVTHSGREWVDPPGIVYPSLLLSPDGSFDKAGAVSPTITGAVSVVDGRYGKAWDTRAGASGSIGVTMHPGAGLQGTIIMRVRPEPQSGTLNLMDAFNLLLQRELTGRLRVFDREVQELRFFTDMTAADGAWVTTGLVWDGNTVRVHRAGIVSETQPIVPRAGQNRLEIGATIASSQRLPGLYEGVIVYPVAVPGAEIARISAMPTAWTMQNTAVNMALQSQPPAGSPFLQMYPPNRKIATGGATLRTAPGPSTQAITTLAAGTDVHDTKQTVSVSSVSYSLVVTAFGNAWVPTSTLV